MTPAEERFVRRVTASASMLAEFFANEPDETKVIAALSDSRENLTADLTEAFGAEVAALFAERFVALSLADGVNFFRTELDLAQSRDT
jgi:hypothetical protein